MLLIEMSHFNDICRNQKHMIRSDITVSGSLTQVLELNRTILFQFNLTKQNENRINN